MSEWFKEHDWKSCVGLKLTGGSNPLLCATKKSTLYGCSFSWCKEEIEKHTNYRRFARAPSANDSLSPSLFLSAVRRFADLSAIYSFSAPRKRLRNIRSIVCNKQKAPFRVLFYPYYPFTRLRLPFLRIACQLRP